MHECLDRISDLVVSRGLTQSDYLMSGFAVFRLKKLSWLLFDELFCLNERSVRARNHNAQPVPESRYSGLVGVL